MAIKKSELYSSLWKSCDQLRGGMDASQYKDYVLVLLFVKYVSDKYANDPDGLLEIPPGGSFADMVALKGKPNIGEGMNLIIARLAEANGLTGVIDVADFDDPDKLGSDKEMVERLSNLVAIFEDKSLDFSSNKADGDDILGDAYEYLMRHFATESGKSKGQFYTPAEVSRVLAQVVGVSQASSQEQTIYDPTCGSGSLLLKAAYETPRGITIYGQEMDNATAALAKMNMILHNNPTAEIIQGNTLASPKFKNASGGLKTFDFIVANPPFSSKAWSNGIETTNDPYQRFAYGVPPEKNGDYAFLLHILASLKSTGKAAVILPHGVLFRGNAEADIRTRLIQKGFIKGIIGLPANLFYGTGIPACIIVIDKQHATDRQGIFMIDASKGFAKDGNKNRLREQDIHRIVDVFTRQLELAGYSRMVPITEIQANEYNLNIPRYIDSQQAEDLHDIAAHLRGGIPESDIDALAGYWQVYPSLKSVLFKTVRPGYSQLAIESDRIKDTIFAHPEFVAYTQLLQKTLQGWSDRYTKELKQTPVGANPKKIIHQMAESILADFSGKNLVDNYDVYQHLLNYANATLQDDLYQITTDGWKLEISQKKKDVWDCDLVPKPLVLARYFQAEQKAIEQLEASREEVIRQREELEEEHSGEDGLMEPYKNDKGKLAKADIAKRYKVLKNQAPMLAFAGDAEAASDELPDELSVLESYLNLTDQEAQLEAKLKTARAALDKKLLDKYKSLSTDEIKTLLVEDKWMAAIGADVTGELERISHRLAQRLGELAERYAQPLSELEADVQQWEGRVRAHLTRMGF
jgi:type I restriction enzyme M protein